jgi:hypothetical protein
LIRVTVWEITNKWMNSVACVGPAPETEFIPDFGVSFWRQFEGEFPGQLLEWTVRPELVALPEDGRKKPLPRADVSPFTAPGLVVNEKVRAALGDFLEKFGQLLEITVDGETEYFYNITHVISCLDRERSEIEAAYVEIPVFHTQRIPIEPTIFIEPSMPMRYFANDAAKWILEEGVDASRIVGMSFKGWSNNDD